MEISRFIIWWWRKTGVQVKILILFALWVQTGVFIAYFFSVSMALAILFGGIGLAGLGLFISSTAKLVKVQWRRYQYEQEQEAQRIINRLKGHV